MCIKSLLNSLAEDVAENMTEHELQYQDGTMPVSCSPIIAWSCASLRVFRPRFFACLGLVASCATLAAVRATRSPTYSGHSQALQARAADDGVHEREHRIGLQGNGFGVPKPSSICVEISSPCLCIGVALEASVHHGVES